MLRHCFGDEQEKEQRDQTANASIDDEQRQKRFSGNKPADRWPDDPGEVSHHAKNAEPLLALMFGQEVADHGAVGWAGNIGEQADTDGKRNQCSECAYKPEHQCAEGAEDQAKNNQLAAPKLVGQCTANHLPEKSGDGE